MSEAIPITGYIHELEQLVLGALLSGGDLRKVSGFLRDYHFVADVHMTLYRAICTAFDQYGSNTLPIVARLLPEDSREGFIKRIDKTPAAYMAELCGQVTSKDRLESDARAVIVQWARLRAGEEGLRLHAAANDPSADPSMLIKSVTSDLSDIAGDLRSGPGRKTLLTLSDAAENAFASAEEARQKGTGVSGVTWGLSDVNRATGGIHAGEVVLIGARPSAGKTALGLSCAIKSARSGSGIGFISLEMGSTSLANRAITDIAYDWNVKVAYSDFGRGRLDEREIDALRSATRELQNIPLWIEEQPGLSMADIRVKSEQMMEKAEKAGAPIRVMWIDYLGLIKPAGRYSGNKVAEVTEISAGLKDFSRECGIGVVALSQLSRQVESRDDKRPQLSDLRDSGALEQDADTIMFLYREAYYLERSTAKSADAEAERINKLADCQNKLEMIVAKQRNGPVCTVDLFIEIGCSAIRNGEKSYGR